MRSWRVHGTPSSQTSVVISTPHPSSAEPSDLRLMIPYDPCYPLSTSAYFFDVLPPSFLSASVLGLGEALSTASALASLRGLDTCTPLCLATTNVKKATLLRMTLFAVVNPLETTH